MIGDGRRMETTSKVQRHLHPQVGMCCSGAKQPGYRDGRCSALDAEHTSSLPWLVVQRNTTLPHGTCRQSSRCPSSSSGPLLLRQLLGFPSTYSVVPFPSKTRKPFACATAGQQVTCHLCASSSPSQSLSRNTRLTDGVCLGHT